MAREPEPDLELDEEPVEDEQDELDLGPEHEVPPKQKSRLPFILLVVALVGAGAYFYLFPDMFSGLMGESQPEAPPPPAPVAKQPNPAPAPPAPAPAAPQGQPGTPTAAVTPDPGMKPYTAMPPSVPTPPAAGSTPAPAPSASAPAAPAPTSPPPASVATAAPAMPMTAPGSVPTPLFGEGQRVTVKQDPGSPAGIGLSLDAAGTKQGALLRTGAIVTVLDAELLRNMWVYSVRGDDGTRGWIAESHLAAPK